MKKQLLFLLLCTTISINSQAQSISFTSALPTSTEVGTNLTINYKYTIASPGYIYCGVELQNDWAWISTVGSAQLDPAPAGTDRTGSFSIFIPNNTPLTTSLSGNQNYKIKIELKNSSYVWLTGDYPPTRLNFTTNLSIDDNNFANKIAVYPNPVVDVLNIDKTENLSNASFSVINTLGETIMQTKTLNNDAIDVSSLSSGMYILSVDSGDGKQQFKFLKQ